MWLHVYSSSFQSDCCDTVLGCPFFRSLLRHCVPLRKKGQPNPVSQQSLWKLLECQKMFQVWDPIPLGFPLSSSWHAALALLSSSHETGKVKKKTFLNIGELIFNCCPCRGAELLSQWEDVVGARETRKLSFASSLLRGVTGVKDFSHTGDHF